MSSNLNVQDFVFSRGELPRGSNSKKQMLYDPANSVVTYGQSGGALTLGKSKIRQVLADTGVSASFSQQSIYRLKKSGMDLVQSCVLVNTVSGFTSVDASRSFVPVLGLNLIKSLEVWVGSKKIVNIPNLSDMYRWILTNVDSDELEYVQDQINDVVLATRQTQAQGSGVTVYLPLARIINWFSQPIPIWAFNADLEIRVNYNDFSKIAQSSDPITTDSTISSSYLLCDYVEVVPQINDIISEKLNSSTGLVLYDYEVLSSSHGLSTGSSDFIVNLPYLAGKDVVAIQFILREDADISAGDYYTNQTIASWNLKSAGRSISGYDFDMTDEIYKRYLLDEDDYAGKNYLRDNDIYSLSFSSDFRKLQNMKASNMTFAGSMDFNTHQNPELHISLSASLANASTLTVNAIIAKLIAVQDGDVYEH